MRRLWVGEVDQKKIAEEAEYAYDSFFSYTDLLKM